MIIAAIALALPVANVIDVGPGLSHPTIQSGVVAAANGDVVRVAAGLYPSFTIPDRSITLLCEEGAVVSGTCRIHGLSVGRSVVIDNLDVRGAASGAGAIDSPLVVGLCAGSVRLQRCEFLGADALTYGAIPHLGARIESCADVSMVDCTVTGGSTSYLHGTYVVTESQTGLYVGNSTFSAQGCSIRGSSAFGSLPHYGLDGGDGVDARMSEIHFNDVECKGGIGGWGNLNHPWGSSGVAVVATQCELTILSSVLTGSTDIQATSGTTVQFIDGDGLGFAAPASLSDIDGPAALDFEGQPGDLVLLVTAPTAGKRPLPGFFGALLVAGPPGTIQRQMVGVGASLQLDLPVPDLAPFETLEMHLQSVHLRPRAAGTDVIFGPPRTLVVLDELL